MTVADTIVDADRVHVDDRGPIGGDGTVDLALLGGRTIRMHADAACALLRTTPPTLRKLIDLGLVQRGGPVGDGAVATTRWILLDPADDRRSLYERWVAALGRPRSHREFDRYIRARDACVIPGREMPEPAIVDGMLTRLLEIGAFNPAEYRAFAPNHPTTLPQLRKLIWSDGVQRVPRRDLRGAIRPTDEMVLEAAPGLRDAPGTVFERLVGGDDLGRPKDGALRAALGMGPLRQAALLWAHVAAATYRRSEAIRSGVRRLGLIDELLIAAGVDSGAPTAAEIGAALERMAFSPAVRLSRSARFAACRDAMTMTRHLQIYARLNDPDGTRGISSMVPPAHPERLAFTARLLEVYGDLPAAHRTNRKRTSDRAAARYENLCDIETLRMEQVVASQQEGAAAAKRLLARSPGDPAGRAKVLLATKTGGTARKARGLLAQKTPEAAESARALLAKAAADSVQSGRSAPDSGSADRKDRGGVREDQEAFEGFTVETTVMTPKGELLPGSQACHWRAWRERDLWLDIAARKKWLGSIEDEQIVIHLRQLAADPEAYPEIVFEWRGCAPLHGDRAIAPWFVTICNMGVLTAPGSMTVRQRRRRHQFMVTWKLPAYNGSAEGLLNFGGPHGVLWRWADDSNRHVVPLNQFALAMRFTHLAFITADETMCRLGELLQQRQDADAWPIDRSTGSAEPTFLAIPKTSAFEDKPSETRFAVSQELFVEATTLARDVAHLNGHEDGVLPLISPAKELTDRRTDEGAWIFQHNDRALNGTEMNRFLAFLFGNVIDINFHDIRHASANAALLAGVPEESVQALLNHRRRDTSLYYMRRNRMQRSKAQADGVRRRRTRAAVTLAIRGEIPNPIKV